LFLSKTIWEEDVPFWDMSFPSLDMDTLP
jgi:hypothetical protein